MAVFKDVSLLQGWFSGYFNIGAAAAAPAQLFISLLDGSGAQVAGLTRVQKDPGATHWQSFTVAEDCSGDPSTGVGTTGVSNKTAIDFGQVPAGQTWVVEYVAVFDAAAGGTEVFRIPLEDARTFISDEGVVMSAGSLKFGSEYVL